MGLQKEKRRGMSGERGGKLADWAYRNPNGLQPVCAFAEDYRLPGHLHYNVPPIRLAIDEGSGVDLLSEAPWHGYTGAKPFFTQQPMPGATPLLLTGGYAPNRSEVCEVINETPNPARQNGTSAEVPCNDVVIAAQTDKDAIATVAGPQVHPIQVGTADPRLWRFDGREHCFPSPPAK